MNRCAPFLAAVLALAPLAPARAAQAIIGPTLTVTPAASMPVDGTLHRKFPQNALRGVLVFGAPPAIQLNGTTSSLAPGYRIHGTNNLLVMSAQLTGLQFTVDYTTDVQGQVYEVWLLTASEVANAWPTTTAQAAAWTFDPVTQTWTKP